jgi:Methionyl-tRNA formyltransferase
MKITVFTSNQPRHIALIESLSGIADQVYAVQECTTVFPGKRDDFFRKSSIMQEYFSYVMKAENEVFGNIKFTSSNVTQLVLKSGDLSMLDINLLRPALQSDIFIVFGASYIKSPLIDILIEKEAINIHMGVSPYYRGNSCNFWALYDGNPHLVGATIHKLGKGLDSGDILYHAFPPYENVSCFLLGFFAVKSAHRSLVRYIKDKALISHSGIRQDKELEIRYTKNNDFTNEIAERYLSNLPEIDYIEKKCKERDMSKFINPYILKE